MPTTPLVLGSAPFPAFNPGRHLMDGNDINTIGAMLGSAESGKTATAGGGRATAYPIRAANTQFSVVASAADSCVLPPSYPGLRCFIINQGANAMQVFASGSDTINIAATAGATGVSQAATAAIEYYCVVTGNWRQATYI